MENEAAAGEAQSQRSRSNEMQEDSALDRWFKEEWVDISKKDKSGKHPPCGRKDADEGKYPKCRPSKRVSKKTPKTSKEMSKAEKERAKRNKKKVEKKRSKPAGGKARKPKRAPSIKKRKKSSLIALNSLNKLARALDRLGLREEAGEVDIMIGAADE